MPDTNGNFTCMTDEEIMSELEEAERLDLAIKRTQSQLNLFYQCPGLILWAKEGIQLRGKEAQNYLEKKLTSLIRAKVG